MAKFAFWKPYHYLSDDREYEIVILERVRSLIIEDNAALQSIQVYFHAILPLQEQNKTQQAGARGHSQR